MRNTARPLAVVESENILECAGPNSVVSGVRPPFFRALFRTPNCQAERARDQAKG